MIVFVPQQSNSLKHTLTTDLSVLILPCGSIFFVGVGGYQWKTTPPKNKSDLLLILERLNISVMFHITDL